MIQILKPPARWLLLLVDYITSASAAIQPSDIFNAIHNRAERGTLDSGIETALREVMNDPQPTWEELKQELTRALNPSSPPDVSLIDKMVDILKLPNTANVLSGATLHALRAALLTSTEQHGLDERLKEANIHCAQCGKLLRNNEVATLYTGQNPRADHSSFRCIRCGPPRYQPCLTSGCEVMLPFIGPWDGSAKTRKHHFCPDHMDPTRVVEAPPATGDEPLTWSMIQRRPAGGRAVAAAPAVRGALNLNEVARRLATNPFDPEDPA